MNDNVVELRAAEQKRALTAIFDILRICILSGFNGEAGPKNNAGICLGIVGQRI